MDDFEDNKVVIEQLPEQKEKENTEAQKPARRGRPRKKGIEMLLNYKKDKIAQLSRDKEAKLAEKNTVLAEEKADQDYKEEQKQLESLSLKELKAICKERCFLQGSSKKILISNIRNEVVKKKPYFSSEAHAQRAKEQHHIKVSRKPLPVAKISFSSMKLPELRLECKQRGLKITGNKAFLLKQLLEKEPDEQHHESDDEPEHEREHEPEPEPVVSEKVSKSKKSPVEFKREETKEEEIEESKVEPSEFSSIREILSSFKYDIGAYVKVFNLKKRKGLLIEQDKSDLVQYYNSVFEDVDNDVCDLLDDILDLYGSSSEYNKISKCYTNLKDRTRSKVESLIS